MTVPQTKGKTKDTDLEVPSGAPEKLEDVRQEMIVDLRDSTARLELLAVAETVRIGISRPVNSKT